jgi:UDP-N-acetylmuramyl pentapeptide phosphotransferase/UDP-N-acetylglucosamine-1-phosphate transferase
MPQLQGMGHDQTPAQLCGGVSVFEASPVAQSIWVALFFVITLAGTWLARRYALMRQLLDQPGDRRSHTQPTPRGGGIAIVVAMLLALGLLAWLQPREATWAVAAAGGLCLVGGIGWIDDHRPLSPLLRLIVQALASLLLAWVVWDATAEVVPAGVAWVAAMVLINVWNFMDGIDGLAASQAMLVALAYRLVMPPDVGWLALALVGACAGFLPFNVPRARVFLGDVGSGALGYLLAVLLVQAALEGGFTRMSAWLLLLPPSAFLIDAALTLLARIASGQQWWLPHVEHAYQHWARRMRRHGPVTLAYAGWTAIMSALMLMMRQHSPRLMMMVLALASLSGYSVWAGLRWQRRIDGDNRE